MAKKEEIAGGKGWAHAFAFTLTFADGILLQPRDTGAETIGDLSEVESILYEYKEKKKYDIVSGEDKFRISNWRKMGEDMSKCTNLKQINLDGCTIVNREEFPDGDGSEALMALFGEDRAHKFPLEELELCNVKVPPTSFQLRCGRGYYPHGLCDNALLKILPFVKSMPTLKCLDLSHNGLHSHGAMQLSRALQDIPIEKLYLNGNSIADEGIQSLLGGKNSARFVEFHIHDQRCDCKRRGRDAIMEFLRCEDNAIESFGVDCKEYKHAKKLIASLPKTSNLTSLVGTIGSGHKNAINAIAPFLEGLICDASSLETLCRSNCRLRRIGRHTEEYLHLRNRRPPHPNQNAGRAICIHRRSLGGASEVKILRGKIRAIYFVGEFDVQPFLDMDVALMPYVLGLVTKKILFVENSTFLWGSFSDEWVEESREFEFPGDDLDVVYRLVRRCHVPEMFGFPPLETKISSLEAENESLSEENARLMQEVAELRSRLAASPSKRAKTTKS